jgi:hypothetical protein
VWVCARGPLTAEDGLLLAVNDERLGLVTQAQAVGPRPQPTSVGFYRLPVSRAVLERRVPAAFELRRAPGSGGQPVEVCGTFSYRPTAGPDASTFFDGTRWLAPPQPQGRFLIELRLEGPDGRPIAAWY